MTRKRRWLSFFAGLVSGLILFLGLAAAVFYIGGNQTWAIRINTHGMTERLDQAIQLTAEDMLPAYIDRLRPTVPVLVAENVYSQFADAKFQLGGEEFALPKEFVGQLEENYRTSMVNSIYELLDSLAIDTMGEELSIEIAGLVEQAVYAEFNSQEMEIGIIKDFLTIPIVIELVNQPGASSLSLQLYSERLEQ